MTMLSRRALNRALLQRRTGSAILPSQRVHKG
jgi:hypothetical protein